MKKFFKAILWVLLAILAAVIAAVCVWQGEIRTLAGVKQVSRSNPYLYSVDYKAPYDLDKVLEAGLDENIKLVEFVINSLSRGIYKPDLSKKQVGNGFACTSFQAKNAEGDGWLFGRNYDLFKAPVLVLKSNPDKGYSSISTCDLSHLGYTVDKLPQSVKSKALCLAAVYAPMDGMNEKGLCVSIMALPKQPAWQDTGKPIAGTSILIRLILDRCATVDEAVELVNSVDVRHDRKAGGYHYLVADAQGNCAAIEFDLFDGWKTMILRKPAEDNYMHMTNHLLNPKYYTTEPNPTFGNPASHSWWRYEEVQKYMQERNGILTVDQAQECLSNVHWKDLKWENSDIVEDTLWSDVFDQSALTLRLRDWYDYEKTYFFAL